MFVFYYYYFSGKDKIIFVTEEDHELPEAEKDKAEDEEPSGIILPNGEINWDCPCLGGMADGAVRWEVQNRLLLLLQEVRSW